MRSRERIGRRPGNEATTDEHTSSKSFVFTAYQNTSEKQTKFFLTLVAKLLTLYNMHVEHFPSYELVLFWLYLALCLEF